MDDDEQPRWSEEDWAGARADAGADDRREQWYR